MHWLLIILVFPYLFLFLKIYKNLRKIKVYSATTNSGIFVSVVIACLNEQENLLRLLSRIALQDYPKSLFEVIVVDDNSTDRSYEIATSFKGIGNIIVTSNDGIGKKQAIRTGVIASTGRLIITTDADCRMKPAWISTIASFYENYKPDMIVCPVQIEPRSGFFGRFQELEFLSLQGVTAGSVLSKNGTMCNGANLSFTKEAYLNNVDNLHFEIASGDDIFLLHCIKKRLNSKILWIESPDAMITTVSSPNVLSFLEQRARWISKGNIYQDRYTILIAIVTFVTIILQVSVLLAGFINPVFILVFLTIFILKSVPDFLILFNTSGRYMKRYLMNWFLPVQIFYPFYVLCVGCYSLIHPKVWKVNSPSPKET